jgi:magnesium transporter
VPGTLATTADHVPPAIERIVYTDERCRRESVERDAIDKAFATANGQSVWLDVQGLGDMGTIRAIGAALELHPLTLEDVVHVHQRPKVEEFDDYLFVTLRTFRSTEDGQVDNEQLSFVLKDGLLVTFQERAKDGFDPIRKRLEEGKGSIRHRGVDYLMYALIDVAIDNYFPVLELYGDTMDQLDEEMRAEPAPHLASATHAMRRELRKLRQAVWPLRDVTGSLGRNEIAGVDASLRPSFRDCHDHVIQVAEFVDSSRERAAELADLYQTMISDKTNQVMRVLTIIATIFIPLTFLCGLYGMNFDPDVSPYNMPELRWRYGYLALWGVMISVFFGMLWFFKRKGWIGRGRD